MTDDTVQLKNPTGRGPHPLSLHVAGTTQNWLAAAAALPLFQLGGLQVHPSLKSQAADLHRDLGGQDLEAVQIEVMKQAQTRLKETLDGMTRYQNHPYRRNVPVMPLQESIGSSELRDYAPNSAPDAPLVLAVPSLVNPAYVLDLQENHSFLRCLADQGLHPYLLDWTLPGSEELTFDLEGYITQRLMPLIRRLHQHHGQKIHLVGYCMGGNLCLAAAQLLQEEGLLHSLTLMATPWDFHADQPVHLPALTEKFIEIEAASALRAPTPVNIMQMFFYTLDPTLSDRKFRHFATLDPDSDAARHFVALEDWANGENSIPATPQSARLPPLAPPVARDCLIKWYKYNQPHEKQWKIAGQIIAPVTLRLPGRLITPTRDRIVPPASAKALIRLLPHFDHHVMEGGHVSMIAGQNAKDTLWREFALYLK
ncbi:alpha/beta fold hydrolase [Paremcibacter congregatus]|uniref:alpha/beta fold hydrolase n=1 Tax=Paremcibacter congregatus TaxID=2043170 RepID=UPI0030EC7C2E|tara:strand:+ start:8681 stop:9955 length:1275 start_codon:yes stop_codon:yes gene_type:complete